MATVAYCHPGLNSAPVREPEYPRVCRIRESMCAMCKVQLACVACVGSVVCVRRRRRKASSASSLRQGARRKERIAYGVPMYVHRAVAYYCAILIARLDSPPSNSKLTKSSNSIDRNLATQKYATIVH